MELPPAAEHSVAEIFFLQKSKKDFLILTRVAAPVVLPRGAGVVRELDDIEHIEKFAGPVRTCAANEYEGQEDSCSLTLHAWK